MLAAMRRASSRVSSLVLRPRTEAARKKRAPNGQGGHGGLASYGSGRPEHTDLNRLKTTIGLLDGPGRREAAGLVGQGGNAAQLFWYCRNRSWRAVARCAVASGGRVLMAQHSAAAPLSVLLRIGGKRKPRTTEASGASRTGNLGEVMGASFPVHLPKTTARVGLGSGGSQQLRQLGKVGGDAPGRGAAEQPGS